MEKYQIVIKQTHYWQHQIEASNKVEAVRKLREGESGSDPVCVDELYGDWQEFAEGEFVSVEKVEDKDD